MNKIIILNVMERNSGSNSDADLEKMREEIVGLLEERLEEYREENRKEEEERINEEIRMRKEMMNDVTTGMNKMNIK